MIFSFSMFAGIVIFMLLLHITEWTRNRDFSSLKPKNKMMFKGEMYSYSHSETETGNFDIYHRIGKDGDMVEIGVEPYISRASKSYRYDGENVEIMHDDERSLKVKKGEV